MNATLAPVSKQPYEVVPFANGLQWRGGGDFLYEEKLDGVWTNRLLSATGEVISGQSGSFAPPSNGGAALLRRPDFTPDSIIGEQLRSGAFFSFDLAIHDGEDIRHLPLRQRLERLDDLTKRFGLLRPARGTGGEFLETIVTRGGEGVVAKPLDGNWWTPLYKCKRAEVFHCVVLSKDEARQSVELGLLEEVGRVTPCAPSPLDVGCSMLDVGCFPKCGRLALGFDRFQQCRVGSLLKVEAYGLTKTRQLREARPDKDAPGSWLIQF